MVITKMALPRRTFLRGMGVSLALPLLDAMAPALSATPKAIPRLGFFYVPNGIMLDKFFPTGDPTTWEVSPIVQPLEPYRDQLNVYYGLASHEASRGTGNAQHAKAQTAFLSGVFLKETEGSDVQAGKTVDQFAADVIGRETPLRSLELGTEPGFLSSVCETGVSCVYQNTLAWRDPTTPLPVEYNPRVVFERMFGEGGTASERLAQSKKDKSILDWAMESIQAMQKQLGPPDRARIGEYLAAVRDVEQRIQLQEKEGDTNPFAIGTPPVGVPEDHDEHTKLLFDLTFLAYRADLCRVVTYLVRREESQMTYPQIGVPEAHHWASHHGGNPEKMAMNVKINIHHVNLFSRLVERMKRTQDGDGTLLDHAVLVYGGGMGDGNMHNSELVPLLTVGSGAGNLKGGRFLKYREGTPLTNLQLTLLEKVGVTIDKLGDSNGPLTDV